MALDLQPTYDGKIHLIIGPMYAGKTSELIRIRKRSKIAGRRTISIKYCRDTRYGTHPGFSTHDEAHDREHDHEHDHSFMSNPQGLDETARLLGLYVNPRKYDDVFIDELQFYHDGPQTCDKLANLGYHVYVSGLQSDFRRQPFPSVAGVMAMAETITHLTSIDSQTGGDASFTQRFTHQRAIEVIGGLETYRASSRKTYFRNLDNNTEYTEIPIP